MYRLFGVAVMALLAMGAGLAVAQPELVGVLQRNVDVPDRGEADLPGLRRGEIMACAGETPGGYLVACKDAKGTARMALLPYRDEWGHVSAAPVFDAAEGSTRLVRVQVPTQLRPGTIRLRRGDKHLVRPRGEDGYTLLYSFSGLNWEIDLAADDLLTEEPDAQATLWRRKQHNLEQQRETLAARKAGLERDLSEARRANTGLAALHKEVSQAENDIRGLTADLENARKMRTALVYYKAREPESRTRAENALRRMVNEAGETETRLLKAELETEVLAQLQRAGKKATAQLARLRTDAHEREATLKGLAQVTSDESLGRQVAAMEQALAGARGEQADMHERLAQGAASANLLTALADELDRVTGETTRLRGEMDKLDRELEDLNAHLGRLQDPLGGLDGEARDGDEW